MLKNELLDLMTIEEYVSFIIHAKSIPGGVKEIDLPDGRKVPWYENHDVHEFLSHNRAPIVHGILREDHAA